MYEIVVMNVEHVGVAADEIVEHIWTCRNAIDAEKFMAKLRMKGFQPRLRRFECEDVNWRNMDDHIHRLVVLNADKSNLMAGD
ncbi:MAG: hypothetical protein J5716_01715 [Alphaproteobacteria bacterium]|nr:hypothetical protein [Alphaproteobacteria bacterium]